MRTASDLVKLDEENSERDKVKRIIVENLYDKDTKIINIPNKIPPFLAGSVTDKTADVHSMIDAMGLNSHIAEHLKHSVGYYYEDPQRPWDERAAYSIQSKLHDMAAKYRLLDDALGEDADLRDVKYIVIPDVGATDTAITSKTAELDRLFEKNPRLTLVVAFADNVINIEHDFCANYPYIQVWTPQNVKKISFTGKKLQTVRGKFFYLAQNYTTVDLRGLTALRTVGNDFFSNATALTKVDLRGLTALQTVGNHFFSYALNLTSVVDLRGLTALQTVGDDFFSSTVGIESLDLTGLTALQTVGNNFFWGLNAVKILDLRGLSALHTIGHDVFSHAFALTSILVESEAMKRMIQDKFKEKARIIVAPLKPPGGSVIEFK